MKNILVPIDCSDATTPILELARELASALGAALHLVHVREVAPVMPVTPLGYGGIGMPEMAPMGDLPLAGTIPPNEEEKTRLAAWQDEIRQAGLKVTLHEPAGDVLEEILERADETNADLIIMGQHGHGAMYQLLVGSVTEGLLKRSTRPLLLVPGKSDG